MEPLIISLSGEPKSGKTHFALTAPEPIEVFDFDGGVLTLLGKFAGKDIRLYQYIMDVWGKEKVSPMWDGFLGAYKKALAGDAQTIVLDTATQTWEILRLAYFEKESPGDKHFAFEYGKPNSLMRSVISAPRVHGKNLILTHYIREVWNAEGKKTGEIVSDGFKHTEGLANLVLGFEAKARKPTGEDTLVTILRSREARELVGETLTNPDWNTLVALLEV